MCLYCCVVLAVSVWHLKKTNCFYPSALVLLVFEFFYSYFLILFGNIIITVAVCVSLCETVCCWFKSLFFFSLSLLVLILFTHSHTYHVLHVTHALSYSPLSLSRYWYDNTRMTAPFFIIRFDNMFTSSEKKTSHQRVCVLFVYL